MIVYDTTNLQSFQEIEGYWINEIKSNADKEIQIILVGTKTDLERQVPLEAVKSLADSLAIRVFEISSKTGEGVYFMFEEICRDLMKKTNITKPTDHGTKLKEKESVKKKKCCG
jgi:GTPase SAR1 family protein